MKLKLYLLIILSISLMQFICSTGEPKNEINLPVPYHSQVCPNYCGIACIQMWADFDKRIITQQEIASFLGIGGENVSPWLLEQGVSYFTNSQAYLAIEPFTEPNAQGDLIGATICGIQEYIPSIMPIMGDHAVLIKGYKWHEDIYGRPIADKAYYHDPRYGQSKIITANDLKYAFEPCPYSYWVIVGYPSFVPEGREGYSVFMSRGGTYYGGSSRDPQLPPQ